MEINLCNSKGRDATVTVTVDSVSSSLKVRWIDQDKRQAMNRKILKGTLDRDLGALQSRLGDLGKVGAALIEGDPEVDLESFGTFLEESSRVYISPKNEIVYRVMHWEIVKAPDGSEKEWSPRKSECSASDEMGVLPVEFRGIVGALVTQPKHDETKQENNAAALQSDRESQDPQTAPRRSAADLRSVR